MGFFESHGLPRGEAGTTGEFADIVGKLFERAEAIPYPALKLCQCGHTFGRIGMGKGPHVASIRCCSCLRVQWLSSEAATRVRRLTRKRQRNGPPGTRQKLQGGLSASRNGTYSSLLCC
jgi:hypothetical protein